MKQILITLFVITNLTALSQDSKRISYYEHTSDYIKNELSQDVVIPKKIQFETDRFLKINKLIDPETGKKSKKIRCPWAIYSDSTIYINFRYSTEIQSLELYVKPDVLGRYCVVYADKKNLRTIHSYSSTYYGGGLAGVLINESGKWGSNWIDSEDNKIKIFIVDTENIEIQLIIDNSIGNAKWKILSRKNINEILNLELSKDQLMNLTLEDVKEIIEKKNNVG